MSGTYYERIRTMNYQEAEELAKEADAEVAQLQQERDALWEALRRVTEHMDRAGGDRDGMPECPWCKAGPDGDDHAGDCELVAVRAALATSQKGA